MIGAPGRRDLDMQVWVQDLESMEAVNRDALIRGPVPRMAGLVRGGRLDGFIGAVGSNADLDDESKATVLALARDETFLLAAEGYMRAGSYLH
jgi:hypothetical protein